MTIAYHTNTNGSIREFTGSEIAAMEIETTDVRQGGFPTHTASPREGVTTKATYFCKYDQYEAFKAYMLGAAVGYTDAGDLKISRLLPQAWPDKPRIACVEVNPATGHVLVDDSDDDLPVPQYERMKVAVTFQSLPYDLRTDADTTSETQRYVQVMPSTSEIQYLNLPGGTMVYKPSSGSAVPNNKPIPYGVGFPIPTLNIARKWHRVPWNCWGEGTPLYGRVFGDIQAGTKPFAGTCNVDELFGYPAGYLLYVGVEEEIDYDPLGDELCWNLTHKWIARTVAPHNWLYFYSTLAADAASNGWYLAVKKGASYSTIELLPDETSLFNGRQHALLFRTY